MYHEERRKTLTLTEEDFELLIKKLSHHLEQRIEKVENKFDSNTEEMKKMFMDIGESLKRTQSENLEVIGEIDGKTGVIVGLRHRIELLETSRRRKRRIKDFISKCGECFWVLFIALMIFLTCFLISILV